MGDESSPEPIPGPDGTVALQYTRFATERLYGGVRRAFVRFVDAGSPVPARTGYSISTETGQALVPGTDDIGNHCDDCVTDVRFPFPVRFFGETYDSAIVGSDGLDPVHE